MARDFAGGATNDYLQIESGLVTAYPFTMGAWFNADQNTTNYAIMSVTDKDQANRLSQLQLSGGDTGDPLWAYQHNYGGASGQWALTSTGFTIGQWHHGLAVFAAIDDRRIYIDGGSKGTDVDAVGDDAGVHDRFTIGTVNDSTPANISFEGQIGECALWSAILTDDDAAMLASGASPLLVKPELLVAYWPLLSGANPEIDIVNRNNVTEFNSPGIATTHPPIRYPTIAQLQVLASEGAPAASALLEIMLQQQLFVGE